MAFILIFLTAAVAYSGQEIGSGSCRVSSRFPSSVTRWCSQIRAACEESGLPDNLVAALIWHESGGNPRAYSSSGAVGLMQVMPRDGLSARFLCEGNPCFQDRPAIADLRDPAFNIQYGTRLLAGYIDYYSGNMREALKAYGPFDSGYSYADTIMALYRQYGRP
jgi:soluble lytic murein transglycosylase-like protein